MVDAATHTEQSPVTTDPKYLGRITENRQIILMPKFHTYH